MIVITNAMLSIPTLVSQYPDRLYSVFVIFVPSVPDGALAINAPPTVPWMNVPMYNAVMMNMMANAAPIIISQIALRSAPKLLNFRFAFMKKSNLFQGIIRRWDKNGF